MSCRPTAARASTAALGSPAGGCECHSGSKRDCCRRPKCEILQGLQVVLAAADIAAQHVLRGVWRRQAIVGGVQAIIGEHQQLRVQRLAARLARPQRDIALLLVQGLQACKRWRIEMLRQIGTHAEATAPGPVVHWRQVQRRRRADRQRLHRQRFGCGDQWCNEQANAQVTCVF